MYFDTTNENRVNWNPFYVNKTPKKLNYHQTPFTSSSTNNFNMMEKKKIIKIKEEDHNYILIKDLPKKYGLKKLENLFKKKNSFERIISIPNSKNIYAKFESFKEAEELVKENNSKKTNKLDMCLVKKLPLDLNKSSRIVLITVYNEKVEVNVYSIYEIFKEFGVIKKIIIFKKKNFQVFIEFAKTDDAYIFKSTLHNQNYKGYFFLKIQFTRKKNLKVNNNNLYEFDFTLTKKKPIFPHTTNFDLNLNQTNFINNQNNIMNPNIVTSLQNFDEFEQKPKKKEKTIKMYVLKIKNNNSEIKHKTFFNLFSLYGKLSKISINKNNGFVYVFFFAKFDQMRAFKYLNNIKFFENNLIIEVIKTPIKNIKDFFSYVEFQQIETMDYLKKPSRFYLFERKKPINKPNNILYLYNLTELITVEMIQNMFENFEKVDKIQYMNKTKNSALCFFKEKSAAIKILCIFKNMKFIDKNLKINFATEEMIKTDMNEKRRSSKFGTVCNIDDFDDLIDLDKLIENKNSTTGKKSSNFQLFTKSKFKF